MCSSRRAGYGVGMSANVFVLGLDELNLTTLQHLSPDAYTFHPLLEAEDLLEVEKIDLAGLLAGAQEQLEAFDGPIDAIIGYWDFPVSSMVPMLCERFGLPGPTLESVVKCEHKYWSRLEQQKVIDEIPKFGIVDLDEQDELPVGLEYPVWLKPVKSASSELAFRVENRDELRQAMEEIREGIDKFADPFEFVLKQLDLPPDIAEIGAKACLAEEAVSGRQITVEGYRADGETRVYGIVDSITYPDSPSFLRYQYPSSLPDGVRRRLAESSSKVIEQIGLESTTFNIEYFWEPETDRIRLLEVNPRHSQSHAIMFEYVDGVSNHEVRVKLALGRTPRGHHRAGPYATAAKWFLRVTEDGLVVRSPSPADVDRVEQELDGVQVHIMAEAGRRLSELSHQDSYSFELAEVFVGASDEKELIDKYERCVAALSFEIEA